MTTIGSTQRGVTHHGSTAQADEARAQPARTAAEVPQSRDAARTGAGDSGASRQAARGAEQARIAQLGAPADGGSGSGSVQRGIDAEAALRSEPLIQRLSEETRNDVVAKLSAAPPESRDALKALFTSETFGMLNRDQQQAALARTTPEGLGAVRETLETPGFIQLTDDDKLSRLQGSGTPAARPASSAGGATAGGATAGGATGATAGGATAGGATAGDASSDSTLTASTHSASSSQGSSASAGSSSAAADASSSSAAARRAGADDAESADAASANAAGGGGSYTRAQLEKDLGKALEGRPGLTSGRYIGRDGQIDKWSDKKLDELMLGVETAQQFFPNMSKEDLAHMIIAEGAQESSGDFNLNVGGLPGDGQGFMQATAQSVLKDYKQFGTAIEGPDGSKVLDPDGELDMGNVAQNVAMWAWYSHNGAAINTSLDEALTWNSPRGEAGNFGDAQLAWNQGPHVTNDDPNADYNLRMRDYFVQSGFGTADEFDALQGTAIVGGLMNTTAR